MAKAQGVKREFNFNGVRLQDPDPSYPVSKVMDFWATTHPALVNAVVEGPIFKNGVQVYQFRVSRGDKG